MKFIWLGGIAALLLAACTPPPRIAPDGSISQERPLTTQGILALDGSLWVTDLFGRQILHIDTTSGSIIDRWGPAEGMQWGPDDLTIVDGWIVFTAPADNVVGAITPAGKVVKLNVSLASPNPIQLLDDGRVAVGEAGEDGSLFVFEPSDLNSAQLLDFDEVLERHGGINGFDTDENGDLFVPTGGAATALTEQGGLSKVDTQTFETETIELIFADELQKPGLRLAAGVSVHPNGDVFMVEGLGGSIYRVNPDTGEAKKLLSLPTGTADNIDIDPSGRIFVSTFTGSTIYEVFLDGTQEVIFQ